MGTGYTRNDVSNNIANGNVINASDLDGEFDAIVAAFDAATGHTHDGTSAEGAPIEVTGPNQEVTFTVSAIEPATTNTIDIGTTGSQFKDAFFDGTVDTDGLTVTGTATFSGATISDLGTVTTADINGGTVDGTVIGGASAAAGTFTTLTVNTSSTIDLSNNTSAGDLAIADGGTGASTASAARTNLGLEIGTDVQAYDAQLADVAGLTPTDGNFIVGNGTNFVAESGATARTSLGLGSITTQDANNVTITGGSITGITDITVADGGTGASTAAGARTNLGVVIGTDVQAYDAGLADIASLAVTDGNFIVGDGVNWVAESGATARTSLGLGTIATQDANNVTISGGSVTGITDLAVADGGTGASTAAGARTSLGLEIGTDVQAYDAGLNDIAGLAVTDGNIIVGNGTNWVAESGATARTSLGLAIGTDVQAYDAGLADIAGLAVTDGNFIVGDGANWVAESGATARTSLGLGSIATQDANNVSITGGSISGITDLAIADGGTGASDAATARSNLGAGDVNGPTSATDNAVARFDATTGKLLQNSGVTIDDSDGLVGITSINSGPIAGFRNRIINGGAPYVDQRGPVGGINAYGPDRWKTFASGSGTFTLYINGEYVEAVVGTADASLAAGDYYALQQYIEANNIADFELGAANAKTVTLSFTHKHTLAGTYCVAFRNAAANRSYVAEYTQSVADTEETASITLTLDTTGTWATGTSIGLDVTWAVGSGTGAGNATANTWTATGKIATSNQINLMATSLNALRVKDVQLEIGSTATPFERRPYGVELALCQRYYWRSVYGTGFPVFEGYAGAGAEGWNTSLVFPAEMRTTPTLGVNGTWALTNCTGPTTNLASVTGGTWVITSSAAGKIRAVPNSSDDWIDADAEL